MSNKEYVALNDCPMGVLVKLGVTLGVAELDGVKDGVGEPEREFDGVTVLDGVVDRVPE